MELSNSVKEDHVEDTSRRHDNSEQSETVKNFVDAKELGFTLKTSKLIQIQKRH